MTISNNPLVSIVCAAYNQEEFISKALDSFLQQQGVLDYEIIVHDDASNDRTVRIVKDYIEVSDIPIRLIEEKENQYSKGIGITSLLCNEARGKYIAICEGDDFWIDKTKLQKQYEYMESHKECSFCFTNASLFDNETQKFTNAMLPRNNTDSEILSHGDRLQTEDMLRISFIPTASFFFRKDDYVRRPIFNNNAFLGDRYFQIVLTELGYAHYIPECTVAYRINNRNSLMGQWNLNRKKRAASLQKYCNLYLQFDEWTNEKYHSTIERLLLEKQYDLFSTLLDSNELKKAKYAQYVRELGIKEQIKYYIRCHFSAIYKKLRRIV